MQPHRSQGFTWIELLFVLLLVSVLATLAAPSLVRLSQQWHARFLCEHLVQALEDTRLQAMTQQGKRVLCGGSSVEKCNPSWETGWTQRTFSGKLLAHWHLEGERGRLHYRFFPRGRTALVFLPNGWPEIQNGTFWYCPKHWRLPAFAIRVDRYGSFRVEQPVRDELAQKDGLECI